MEQTTLKNYENDGLSGHFEKLRVELPLADTQELNNSAQTPSHVILHLTLNRGLLPHGYFEKHQVKKIKENKKHHVVEDVTHTPNYEVNKK